MAVIALVVYAALSLFILIMFVRIIIDLVMSVNRGWRPTGAMMVVAEVAFTITDPPMRFVRRFLPPMRVGGMALDFSASVVILTAIILSFIASGFLS